MVQFTKFLNFEPDFPSSPVKFGSDQSPGPDFLFTTSGEIWYPLARGATVICYMRAYNAQIDAEHLSSFLETQHISSFDPSTAILKALVKAGFFEKNLPFLRSVTMGGEAAFLNFVKPILKAKPNLILSNNYGPSESTIDATTFVPSSEYNQVNIIIGHPMDNIGAYVVDSELKPVPWGVCGELLLTGKSLAWGYLNREDLTSERFIWFGDNHCFGNLRAYRTGDLVRWMATGELEFVRRVEHGQVKLRGNRVELGEIERLIEQHPLVISAAAVVEKVMNVSSLILQHTATRFRDCQRLLKPNYANSSLLI
ncbi:hypothetical protein D9758_007288 [Tetrapyrgos nigripes]|uniref:AMP-dependent synthetase/ligase domain-containing protein n=1 Tax=Tetrapyrgos nigripes TaxID=182062 RepID=A0A8H5LLB0_9AGAR|nr:hypothetical protein D9758_007288 [Tetrapyrgos nigripes]